MTYKEFRKNYYCIGETWVKQKSQVEIKMRWTMWEDNKYGDISPAIVTNGQTYVYTLDSLEHTVDYLEDYKKHEFEEDK